MFNKKRREKKSPKIVAERTKKAVTSSLIMTVVALSLCFGILIGGIDTNADITDIFINEPDDTKTADSGNIVVSYDNTDVKASFDLSDENNIKLDYYNDNDVITREIIFSFDSSSRLIRVTENGDYVKKSDNGEKKNISSPDKTDRKNDTSKNEDENVIKICEFSYDGSSTVRERLFKNSELYLTKKKTVTQRRDLSELTRTETYAADAEYLGADEYVRDRYDNPTFYATYDSNNIQISGYSRSYSYDSAGNVLSSSLTDYGKDSIECIYRYDERNNLVYSSVFDKDLATVVTTYAYVYDSDSRISEATKSVTYSQTGEATETSEKYKYENGNLISKTVSDLSGHTISTQTYVYSEDSKTLKSMKTETSGEKTVTLTYEFMQGTLYEKMQIIDSVWDVFLSKPEDETN